MIWSNKDFTILIDKVGYGELMLNSKDILERIAGPDDICQRDPQAWMCKLDMKKVNLWPYGHWGSSDQTVNHYGGKHSLRGPALMAAIATDC